MSQFPPAPSDGWIDPYGQLQPGVPPPGYWQASDGRWYPPDTASADTQVVGPPGGQPYGGPASYPAPGGQGAGPYDTPQGQPSYDHAAAPQQFAPPGVPQPGPTGGPGGLYGGAPGGYAPTPQKSRTGLVAALGAVAVLVAILGGAGIYALSRNGDDDIAANATTTTDASSGDTAGGGSTDTSVGDTGTTAAGAGDDTTSTSAQSLSGVTTAPGAGQIGNGTGCEIIDDTTLLVEVVNETATIQSYFLTIGFFEDGARLGDTVAIVGNLRPGERTIEETFYFDQSGSECEILETDGFEVGYDDDALADVSPCAITGVSTFGDLESELTVTNSGSGTADYSVQLAFVDSGGIRRGSGFANVEAVRAGETAPTDVFTLAEPADDLVCEVVGVDRTES